MADTPKPLRRQPLIVAALASDGSGRTVIDMYVQTREGFVRQRLNPGASDILERNRNARNPVPWHDVFSAIPARQAQDYVVNSPSWFNGK